MHGLFAFHMHKKTILVELPAEMVDRLDRENINSDRSSFISDLLDDKLKQQTSMMQPMDASTEISSRLQSQPRSTDFTGEIKLANNRGAPLGTFNINTVDGFEELSKTIGTLSEDPIVRMRVRKWR